jgi:PAS domain S-box-containing protein
MSVNPKTENSLVDSESNYQFHDIFELDAIQRLQDLFAEANNVASIITQPDGTPITKPSKFSRFCGNIIRKTDIGYANCLKSDAALGKHCLTGSTIQPCLSAGLLDAGASITVGGRHIANWLIGQVRNSEIDEQKTLKYAHEIGVDIAEYKEALSEVPIMSNDQFNKIAKMLFAFANELSEKAYKNLLLKNQIAENEKTTKLLQESEIRYRRIVETTIDGVISVNKHAIITFINQQMAKMLGYEIEELLGKKLEMLLAEDQLADHNIQMQLRAQGKDSVYERRFKRKDGSYCWTMVSAKAIVNSNGISEGSFAILTDITERKKYENDLLEAEWKFQALFNKGPIGVAYHEVVCDTSGKPVNYRFIDANDSYLELTGVDPRGMLVTEAFPGIENDPFDWIRTFGDVAQTGKTIRFEQYLQSINRWYDIVGYQYKPNHFVAAFIEITKRKQAEEALKESEVKFRNLVSDMQVGVLLQGPNSV